MKKKNLTQTIALRMDNDMYYLILGSALGEMRTNSDMVRILLKEAIDARFELLVGAHCKTEEDQFEKHRHTYITRLANDPEFKAEEDRLYQVELQSTRDVTNAALYQRPRFMTSAGFP